MVACATPAVAAPAQHAGTRQAPAAAEPARDRAGDDAGGSLEPVVRRVLILGNRTVSDDTLREGLSTREPQGWWLWRDEYRFDPLALERDRDRIEAYYQRHGHFSARVTDVRVRELSGNRVDVTFMVHEGPPAILGDVLVDGAPELPARDGRPAVHAGALRRMLELSPGQRFIYESYELGKERMLQALQLAGFAHAEVRGKVAVDRTAHRVGVRYAITPGPRVRFGEVSVRGLDRLPESVVRHRVTWSPGEIFDPRAVIETRRRLQALRRFQTVRIELADRDPSPVADIRITAAEGPPREVRLGVGVGIDPVRWEGRVRLGYRVFGFPDALSTFSTELRPAYAYLRAADGSGELVGEAVASIVREDLFLPLMRGDAFLSYTRDEYEAYASQGARVRVGASRSWLDERLRAGVTWQLALLTFGRVDGVIAPEIRADLGLDGLYRLGTFEQSIAYDARDNPLDARRGIYAELRLREAGAFAGSAFSFVTLTSELRGYLPAGERLVLAARARYGRLLSGPGLPITERYFSGGASSHRGFPQQRLSPAATCDDDTATCGDDTATGDDDPVAIGGEALIETSVEARLDLLTLRGQWLGIVGFVDGGRVTAGAETLDLRDPSSLRWAAGLGLRYATPVGPLRLDVGYRLNRYGESPLVSDDRIRDRLAFHLSIGEAF